MNIKKQNKNLLIILMAILFLFNAFKFLGHEGSKNPIPSALFNMVIFLFIIVLSIHEKDLFKKEFFKQKLLDDYFTIK